jgi:uncharacterized protein (DUF2164 family)
MKFKLKNIKSGELLVYYILWLTVFLMPVLLSQDTAGINRSRVLSEWIKIAPFFTIFLIHNVFLFPGLFHKKNKLQYFLFTLLIVLAISVLWVFLSKNLQQTIFQSPQFHGHGVPPPDRLPDIRPRPLLQLISETVLISVLVAGFNAAIKITVKWQHEEQKNKELEKEKLQTELAFLRNQVSPHFFMNTLNNIHALIDVNAENARESIIKLSKLMRYLLYDSEHEKTTLQKEIDFIRNYVDLMRLRFSSEVKIELSFPESVPDIKIPPMLFTSLVENAFKHGVSYQSDSFIGVYLRIHENDLVFRIKNSVNKNDEMAEKGGLGLKNLRKRLELIYGSRFELNSSKNDAVFEVNGKIPINGN